MYLLCLLLEAPDPVLTQPDILWNRPKIITPAAASATETVSEIRDDLEQYREKASDETRYFSMIQKLADTRNDLSWDSHSHTLSFSVGISETQQLSVVLEIFYPQKKSSSTYQILQWNTELTGSWQPDNHQNVFKGE